MSTHILQQVPVADIFPSRDNARQIDMKSESFLELVESIRAGGLQIPIHVWPHPGKRGKFEIRAGERRFKACQRLQHKTISAIIHRGITSQAAMIITYAENKFREPLEPLEEIAEIANCMKGLPDAKMIADLLGQSEHWVRLRANIHKNLCPEWRNAFEQRDKFRFFNNWTIGHLTLVARLPRTGQKELFANMRQYYWQWENVSVTDLERRLSDALQLLKKAPWNLDDETLFPKAGACSACSKRSGAAPLLWFGKSSEQDASKDRCLDIQCWKKKQQAFLRVRAAQLAEKHGNLAYIATEYLSSEEKAELSKKFGRVYDQNDVQKSTKGSKNTIPALVIQGKGAGGVVYVKEKKFAKPAGAKVVHKVTTLKERRAKLQAKRYAQVLIVLREVVEKTEVDRLVYKDKVTGVMALVALYGNAPMSLNTRPDISDQKEIKRLIEQKRKIAADANSEALVVLWNSFKPTLNNILTYYGPVTQTPRDVIQQAKWIAELCQVDIDKILKEISKQKGFTEPASWKGLNPDGTPKTAKNKKVKGKKNVKAGKSD